jgi:hypothetical protein
MRGTGEANGGGTNLPVTSACALAGVFLGQCIPENRNAASKACIATASPNVRHVPRSRGGWCGNRVRGDTCAGTPARAWYRQCGPQSGSFVLAARPINVRDKPRRLPSTGGGLICQRKFVLIAIWHRIHALDVSHCGQASRPPLSVSFSVVDGLRRSTERGRPTRCRSWGARRTCMRLHHPTRGHHAIPLRGGTVGRSHRRDDAAEPQRSGHASRPKMQVRRNAGQVDIPWMRWAKRARSARSIRSRN